MHTSIRTTIAAGNGTPQGICHPQNDLYISERGRVLRLTTAYNDQYHDTVQGLQGCGVYVYYGTPAHVKAVDPSEVGVFRLHDGPLCRIEFIPMDYPNLRRGKYVGETDHLVDEIIIGSETFRTVTEFDHVEDPEVGR